MGEETISLSDSDSECDCFDYKLPSNPNGCFSFDPNSDDLQFTFRGKVIFQSIFQQLLSNFAMSRAESIILSGVGIGGVGALNHAKWVRETLNTSTKMRVLLDSSWFIDFHGSVTKFDKFSQTSLSQYDNNKPQSVLKILHTNKACNDTDHLGYPCCLSAYCILTQRSNSGELAYYPKDTPTFAIISIYDILVLQPALTSVNIVSSKRSDGASWDKADSGTGNMFDYFRIVAEYGGAMNSTLERTTSQVLYTYL